MKKILAVMLSIMILVSTITLVTEASEVLTPVSIYAGARTITVEYDTDEITDENIGEIIITKQNGTPVEFTTKINDEFLTIIAKEEFVRDTEDYYLQIAGTKKLFTVKTLFKPEFVADTTGNKVSGLAITRGNGVVVDVVDKNTIIAGVNEGSIGLDFDDIKNYENASIVADVYYTGDGNSKPNAAFVYNNSSKAPAYAFTYKGAGSTARAYWLLRETHGRYYNRNVMVTDGSGMKDFPGYDTPINPITVMTDNDTKISIVQNNYGSAFSSNTITVGTTSLPADFETNANKYHYVIDKMGAVGTLMMNDTFVDIMDSQDYYDAYNEANGASLNAPTKGYFLISPLTSNFRMILSNVAVITSSIRDLATGTISVESVSTSGTELTVKFTSEGNSIDVSAVKNISDFISLSEGDYDVVSAEGDTLVLKVKEVSYEPSVITIKKNFGYDDLKVEEDINVDYIFNARFGDLSIDTIKGTDSAVVLNFSHDMTDIKISNVKEKIKLSLSGTQVNYTPVIDGESIALDLGTSIKRDVVYDLVVEEGLGYEKVTLKDTVRKYLIMETLVNATFDGGMSDDYISVSRNNECTTEETIPNTTVRNGKLYVEETDWMTVYFDKFGLENHEDYVLKFDMEHYKAAANDNFWINVPKTASGIAHYGANLKGIGWRIKSGEWVKLMQWGPARTGQKGLYEKKTNPGGPVGGFSTDMFDIAGNDGDVTLPASQPVVTSYIIEKEGTKAKLFVNGTLVDNLDMNAMLAGWNSDNPDNKITETVPEKGVLVYSAAHSTGKNGKIASGVAFEGFEASVLKEYTDGGIKIVEEEKTITGKNASGNVKVRNFATDAENIVVLVSAYGENNKFLGSEKVINTQLNPGQMAEANFVFSASEEIKEIRTDVLYNKLETADITVDTMLQTVFESNIITVKGKTDKNEKDRNVFLMFVKDDVFNKSWTSLSETDGNIHIIPLKANENNFEYSFSFKDDGTDYAKMSLYKLVWNENGLDYEKLETYHYAKNSYVESYIEKVKDTKTTPEEFEKYAQSLCIDFKFADNPSKRNVVAESIYNLRSEISDKESFIYVVDTAKARILLLSEIKDNSATTASVNTVLTKYETNARLDLTAYKALNEAQKVKVCVNFIGADYEVKGYDQFVTDFALAVKEAKQPQPPAGGGGGGEGSVGGGAVGGLPMNVTETPAKDAVEITGTKQGFADMDEYDWAKDAVNTLAEEGVITGIGNKMFNPEGVVTREQIAKMIVSVLNELDNTLVSEYSDVDKSGWAVNFIASAKKAGIMQGVSETEFAPLAPVTREDLAVILYRATLKKDKKYEARKTDFTDKAEIADYAKEAVEFMAGAGIINGFEDGSFNPKAPATRAQAAVLIYNALRKGE